MTDEDLAVLILEARDSEPDPFWLPSDDNEGAWRDLPRVRAVWARIAGRVRDQLEANKREQTAATILAAMVQAQAIVDSDVLVDDADTLAPCAVRLADALRAELAKGKP